MLLLKAGLQRQGHHVRQTGTAGHTAAASPKHRKGEKTTSKQDLQTVVHRLREREQRQQIKAMAAGLAGPMDEGAGLGMQGQSKLMCECVGGVVQAE